MEKRTPTTTFTEANGVKLAVHEWPGRQPTIFFIHATGLHGRCWDTVIKALPDRYCLAVDVRGHGRSETPPPPYTWTALGADMAALIQTLGLHAAVGVGHSMGGHLLLQAAARTPAAFAGLLLIEPVIFPRTLYTAHKPEGEHFAARRRNHWQSPQEMVERFAHRPPFASWQPQVLHDYCFHALQPEPQGDGYVLACPPLVEATLYYSGMAPDADIYPLLSQIHVPTRVIRAGSPQQPSSFDMRASPTVPNLARYFPHGRDEHFPEYTHFLPMENPMLVAARIEALVAQIEKKEPG